MDTIKPYNLVLLEGEQIITMPKDSQILSVREHFSSLYLFAKVTDSYFTEDKRIFMFGSNTSIYDKGLLFIDTVIFNHRVYHIFEKREY